MANVEIMQGTTPTFTLRLPAGTDTSLFHNTYFSIRQPFTRIIISGENLTINGTEISVFLPQEESIKLRKGKALIQLNWTYEGGERGATKKKEIDVDDNLIEVVLV